MGFFIETDYDTILGSISFVGLRYYFELKLSDPQPITFPYTSDRGIFVHPMSIEMSANGEGGAAEF